MNREFVKRLDLIRKKERNRRDRERLQAEKARKQHEKEEEMKKKLQAKYEKIDKLSIALSERKLAAGRSSSRSLSKT